MPTVELETESAGRYGELDLETLHRLVAQLGPDNSYLILHRSDKSKEFAQAAIARKPNASMIPGSFVVEFKDATGEQFQAETQDLDRVREVLANWAFDLGDCKLDLEWKPLRF